MEYSSKKRIRCRPSPTQLATVSAVGVTENEQGRLVTAREVLNKASVGMRLKTLENRLHEYTRRGWLNTVVSPRKGVLTKFGVADAWIDLLDAIDTGNVQVTARNTDTVGVCEGEGCTGVGRLIYFGGKRLCSECLNPEYKNEHGDRAHPLVKSNWGV